MPDIVVGAKDMRVNLEIQGFHPYGAYGLMGETFGSRTQFQGGRVVSPTQFLDTSGLSENSNQF